MGLPLLLLPLVMFLSSYLQHDRCFRGRLPRPLPGLLLLGVRQAAGGAPAQGHRVSPRRRHQEQEALSSVQGWRKQVDAVVIDVTAVTNAYLLLSLCCTTIAAFAVNCCCCCCRCCVCFFTNLLLSKQVRLLRLLLWRLRRLPLP